MDHPVNRSVNNPPPQNREAMAAHQSFVDQLSAFFRRNLYWFLIAGFVLLLLQDIFGTHGVLAMRRSQAEARKIQQDITQLDRENQKLQDHVKDLRTDPFTMECIAREDFGLARPGEHIFRTHPRAADPAHPAPPPQSCSAR